LFKRVTNLTSLPQNYTVYYNLLVNDPNSSVREGDIITMTPERHSKHVMHTVSAIVAPYGIPLTERPRLLTQEERETVYLEKRLRKMERRRARETDEEGSGQEGKVVRGKEASEKGRGNKTNTVSSQEEHGRQILPGGLHKFGKINEEMLRGKKRVEEREAKVEENVVRKQEVEAESGNIRAEEALTKP